MTATILDSPVLRRPSKGAAIMTQTNHVRLDEHRQSQLGILPTRQLHCLFSSTKSLMSGRKMASRHNDTLIYWLARRTRDASYAIRSVDRDFHPVGKEIIISEEQLLAQYVPEVAMYEGCAIPAAEQPRYQLDDRLFRGQVTPPTHLRITRASVISLFDLAMTYAEHGHPKVAEMVVDELLKLQTEYDGKDQFLFNRFGISLRKQGLHEAAITCYQKALEYVSNDENLYYNIARAHYENNAWWDCMNALAQCFEYNPELTVSLWLVELIVALGSRPDLLQRYNKPPVPDGVARRAGLLAEAVAITPMDIMSDDINMMRRQPPRTDVNWDKRLQSMREFVS